MSKLNCEEINNHCKPSCFDCFSFNIVPSNVGYLENVDGVEINHPLYHEFERCYKVMRHSVAGQDAIRENAIAMDYIQVPAGVSGDKNPYGYKVDTKAVAAYIGKAHYIEVVSRILDEVEGRIFSKPYKYSGPSRLNSIINNLDSEGLTFEQYIRWCIREVFSVNRFGVLVDWDDKTETPIIKRYVAESIVNWDTNDKGETVLLVLEDEVKEVGQVFSHNKFKRRISFTVEKDGEGNDFVVQRTWRDLNSHKHGEPSFIEYEAPIALSRNGFSLSKIPFIFFGGTKPKPPVLKPLAASALDYFDAHASYRNALWWACNEQPYFKFESGNDKSPGFIGANGEKLEGEIDILFGSANPILLMDGDLKFASVKGIGLEHSYRRLKDTKSEMTGMGARSFNAQTASNIKVQTERMQQKAEGSVIGSISSSTSLGIKMSLELVTQWLDIDGEVTFELNTDYSEDFDIKYMGELIDALDANIMSPKEVFEFLKDNSELFPNQKTYVEHIRSLALGFDESGESLDGLFDDENDDSQFEIEEELEETD